MRSEGYGSCPVCVCPGLSSATHATTRSSRHTYGLSIVLTQNLFGVFRIVSKIAIALPYSRAHGSRPFLYVKRAHFPHSFRIYTTLLISLVRKLYAHVLATSRPLFFTRMRVFAETRAVGPYWNARGKSMKRLPSLLVK